MSEKDEASRTIDGPVLKCEPKFMDSMDARVMQYKYALVKLEHLIKAIDSLATTAAESPNRIVMIHYIVHLESHLYAINESGFFPKLKAIENFKLIKSVSVTTSPAATHIPYDMRDEEVVPLDDLPAASPSKSCLRAFRALCITCKEAYQKRYDSASKELNNEEYLDDLDYLFSNSFFSVEKDFDMVLRSDIYSESCLLFDINPEMSSIGDYLEASLIDIDMRALFTIVAETSKMLDAQRSMIDRYKTIKTAPKSVQDKELKKTPHSAYAIHRVFFWALRINEVYFILRKFGRQIFISNHDHLHDQKFCSFVNNGNMYRNMLQEIDEYFFNTKKNGVLIATITRFLRMDSKHEISPKSIFDFVGFISQSAAFIDGMLNVLKAFGNEWILAELAFRTSHKLPIDNLLSLNDIVEKEKVKDLKVKKLKASALAKQKANLSGSLNAKLPASRQVPPIKRVPTKVPIAPGSPVNSIDSKRSLSSIDPVSKLRTESSTAKPAGFQSPFYLQKQSSATSLQSSASARSAVDKKSADMTTPAGRRRSNSQPLSYNAAATALKGTSTSSSNKQDFAIRSPSGSIKRTGLIPKKPQQASAESPLSSKRSAMDVVKEQKESSPPNVEVRRSASQKFQQHLLEASRSGALYSKEKEVFSNVVFDPNNPSATNLRRQPKTAALSGLNSKDIASLDSKENSNGSQASFEQKPIQVLVDQTTKKPLTDESTIKPTTDQRPTRAQITKLNTRRNSVVMQLSNSSRTSDPTRNSFISILSHNSSAVESVVIKKVRFTGVPEYTPAEDAPENQTSKILKSFAALKMPAVRSAKVKRKDEAFKQEESQLFKQYISQGEPAALQNTNGIFAPGSQITLRFSRFKNRF